MLQIVKGQCLAFHYRDYCAAEKTHPPLNQELHTRQIKKKTYVSSGFFLKDILQQGQGDQHSKKCNFSSVENSDEPYSMDHRRRIRCCNLLRLSCGKRNSSVVFSLCHYMALIQMHTVYRNGYSPSSLCFLDSSCLLL